MGIAYWVVVILLVLAVVSFWTGVEKVIKSFGLARWR